MKNFSLYDENRQELVGAKAEDGTEFVMHMELHNVSEKRDLAKKIHLLKIGVIEFINRQLLPFM
jgi:hypothetical protein